MVSKLQTLTSFWQELNLPVVQSKLDDVATEITARQDGSDVSRKLLIDSMKEFKKDQSEEVRTAVAPLIKSFQKEVDSLSKRSKAAEKAFFDVYKQLADVADPVPVLESALQAQKSLSKLQDYEIEIKQLRETIGDYNKEIQELKAKGKKVNDLQAKVDAYDKNIDQTLNNKIKEVSEQMLEEYNEKLKIVENEKLSMAMKNADLDLKLKGTQRQLKEAQQELFESLNGKEEKKEARSQEVEILMNDLEMSNERATAAEREVELLKEKMEQLKVDNLETREKMKREAESESLVPNLTRELNAKEREVQQLLSDIQKLKNENRMETDEKDTIISDLTKQVRESQKVIQGLEARIQRQSDYEAIKKDLAILQSHEFPQEADEENRRPLEVMILERSKVLQSENTNLRVEKDKLEDEFVQVKKDLNERNKEVDRQRHLITELESHVEQLQEMSNLNRGEAEGRSSADILVDALDGSLENMSSVLLNNSSSLSGDPDSESSKALLPIVQAQRERFRLRNEELEEDHSKLSQQISLLQGEVTDLRGDNIKLYEKIRFLQGYQGNKSNDSSIVVENRYKSHYEQKLDPFASFSHQEKQRRYGQLNVFEKIILSFVQFMMSNKFARLFIFAYSILLHILVFMVLMKLAYSDAYKRDLAAEWHDKYMQHMEDAHGDGHRG